MTANYLYDRRNITVTIKSIICMFVKNLYSPNGSKRGNIKISRTFFHTSSIYLQIYLKTKKIHPKLTKAGINTKKLINVVGSSIVIMNKTYNGNKKNIFTSIFKAQGISDPNLPSSSIFHSEGELNLKLFPHRQFI